MGVAECGLQGRPSPVDGVWQRCSRCPQNVVLASESSSTAAQHASRSAALECALGVGVARNAMHESVMVISLRARRGGTELGTVVWQFVIHACPASGTITSFELAQESACMLQSRSPRLS